MSFCCFPVRGPSPHASLQLLSLSADCKSAHHPRLAVEAKPNGGMVYCLLNALASLTWLQKAPGEEVIPLVMAGAL